MSIRQVTPSQLFETEVDLPSIVFAQIIICFAINSQLSPIRGWGIETHYNNPITVNGRRYVVVPEQVQLETTKVITPTVRLDIIDDALSNTIVGKLRTYNLPFSDLQTATYSGKIVEAV
jgi:hypothetical protein